MRLVINQDGDEVLSFTFGNDWYYELLLFSNKQIHDTHFLSFYNEYNTLLTVPEFIEFFNQAESLKPNFESLNIQVYNNEDKLMFDNDELSMTPKTIILDYNNNNHNGIIFCISFSDHNTILEEV